MPDANLAAIAARQFGAVSIAQCRTAGLTSAALRHRLQVGRLETIFARAVYRIAGAPKSWEQDLWALWLKSRGAGPTPDSNPERELRRFIEKYGLGAPEYLAEIWDDGAFVAKVDALWRTERTALEYDGYDAHAGHKKWVAGIDRDNRLHAHRFEVVHLTSNDLRRTPRRTAVLVRKILVERARYM